MKKRSIIAVLLVLCCVTTCFVGGTFSKYTSSVTLAEQSATVAKWEIKVNEQEISVDSAPTINFDLFGTAIKDTDGTSEESDVADNKIAPGTTGKFTIKVENKSEVNATYAIDYTVTNTANIPVKFSVNGGRNWSDTLNDVSATNIAMTNGSAEITVQWKWEFDATGNNDTSFGIKDTLDEIKVSATITVEQVD